MTFDSFVVSVAKINFGTSKRVEQYFGVVKLDQYNFKRLTRFENILEKLMSIVSGVYVSKLPSTRINHHSNETKMKLFLHKNQEKT